MLTTPRSEESIFAEALELTSPAARAAFLDVACGQDAQLRGRVERLLKSNSGAGSFLQKPVAVTTDRPLTERPGSMIGPYKLREQIGEGGFGVVYVAEQETPVRRKVALKIIKPGMDTKDVIARFEAERQALALMDHPNVARVLDAGATDSGRPYFVMELVQGVTITDFCDKNSLPTRERLALFADVCRAVQHAHQKGIIHRDLKPSNIMVTLHDGKPVAKVIDFGVSKALSQQLTEKSIYTAYGQMIGTPSYMSPEQAEMSGLGIDTRSDIYSLGVLLYELLTGQTPLDAKRLRSSAYAEILRIIREEEPPRPSLKISTLGEQATVIAQQRHTDPKQLRRDLAGELDWIVMKCLEKDRGRRYETANALTRDIERYLRDEPVEACPPSLQYRLSKVLRRHRGPAIAAGLIVLALLAGIVGTSVGLVRANAERKRAVVAEKEAKEQARAAEVAAAAEVKQRKRADEEAAAAKAVLDFVEGKIIGVARPDGQEGGLGRNITLLQALESALPSVEQDFRDQPLIEARLRTTLGLSFRYLGERKIALAQLQRAHALNMQHRPDAQETLVCMNWLCGVYQNLEMGQEGLKLSEETVQRTNAALGPNHRDTLRAMSTLAKLYWTVGRYEDALRLHEETLARQTAALGPDDDDTLLTRMDRDTDLDRLGRRDEGLRAREETLARMNAKYGEGHPNTLNAMGGLGWAYYNHGRHDEALKLREKCLAFLREKFPPDHPLTVAGMRNLAASYANANRQAEALALRDEALALERANLGMEDARFNRYAAQLGENYAALNRHEQAIALGQEIFELLKTKLGPDDSATLRSMVRLASTYDKAGKRADAQQLCRTALERQKTKLGPDHHDTLESMDVLSNLQSGEEQLQIRQQALALAEAKLGPGHADTLLWLLRVASSLNKLDRGAEAVARCDEYARRAGDQPQNIELFQFMVFLRVKHFIKIGDPDGCRATAEMWERLNRTDIYGCYNAAGLRALTAAAIRKSDRSEQAAQRADAEADQAMNWLRKVVPLGFHDFAHMEKTSDFESLRDREDFKKLVAELKTRAHESAGTSSKP